MHIISEFMLYIVLSVAIIFVVTTIYAGYKKYDNFLPHIIVIALLPIATTFIYAIMNGLLSCHFITFSIVTFTFISFIYTVLRLGYDKRKA